MMSTHIANSYVFGVHGMFTPLQIFWFSEKGVRAWALQKNMEYLHSESDLTLILAHIHVSNLHQTPKSPTLSQSSQTLLHSPPSRRNRLALNQKHTDMSTSKNLSNGITPSISNSVNSPTTGNTNPSNTGGIIVTPEVWAKMQSLLALLPAKQTTQEYPSAAN
jgi:hypothetical protein